MRLVFTKLSTPLNYIEIDYGDGQGFRPAQPQDLTQSGDGWYIPLEDNTDARSIRVRTSTDEIESFDMIKEYQIKDNEGNILGGNVGGGTSEIEIEDISCYLQEISGDYALYLKYENNGEKIRRIFDSLSNSNSDRLCYRVSNQYYLVKDLNPYDIACQAENSLLYLFTQGVEADRFYTPLPYRIKLSEHQTENPEYDEPWPETPSEQS